MNNYNLNGIFFPQNLFGMRRTPNRNYYQNTSQTSPNSKPVENNAVPDSAPDTNAVEPEAEKPKAENFQDSEIFSDELRNMEASRPTPCFCEPGPMEPRGEPGAREPAGPPGYPQNSVFASFGDQELLLPGSANLPLKMDIPDTTENISPCGSHTVILNPGHYAIYYYISTKMKTSGFIKLTPVFNDCMQSEYAGYAESKKRKELLEISRYFMVEIHSVSPLLFVWHSSSDTSIINMNLCIQKLCR